MSGRSGFTLLEVMMVTFISSFVFAGVLSAYIFLGRGLARQVNEESLESRSRLALYWFTQDVSTASAIAACVPTSSTTGTPTLFTLTTATGGTVSYSTDWSGGVGFGILNRKIGSSGPTLKLLTNLTSLSFRYYDLPGNDLTSSLPTSLASTPVQQINVKQVYMTYVATAGVASTGAQSNYTVMSPRVIMKNKVFLTDPTNP
jgi:prepilin-type N-terminal cleavage/methylation domain-containing protein